jgi:hypothetical protein
MNTWANRRDYIFRSTKGLIALAISLIALITAVWGTLSGPMAEWGIRDITIRVLGMAIHPEQREGRIIMLYHVIAMAVVAIETYMITSTVRMSKEEQGNINGLVTIGYLMTMFFGLGFAYFGHNYAFHGLFIVGQSLLFFAGCMLSKALWPWNKSTYLEKGSPYARTPKGIDLERAAFFTMAVATLGSACFGAVTGSFWGNGHETFLAENLIRIPHKTSLQLSIIGHLHIMLTLVAVAITLLVGRWLDFKGIWHKISMPIMIFGSITITLGVWTVVPYENLAHTIIYVGAVFTMTAALMLVIFGWKKLINERLTEQGITKANVFQGIKALIHDPLKFGPLWQMVFMNFTVSGVGIFMAIKLDKIFRIWPAREERITLTGHWHILAALIATIIMMYYADMCGLKGKARQWFGWIVIIGSDIAFGSMTIFSMKRGFVSTYDQQPLVDWTMIFADFGLGAIMVVLAMFLLWRIYDFMNEKGAWQQESGELELERITAEKKDSVETEEVVR